MRIAFTSLRSSGVDTNVRTAAHWLTHHGHEVHIVYPAQLPSDLVQYPNLHYHTVQRGDIHYYLARIGIRSAKIQDTVQGIERSIALGKGIQRLNEKYGIEIAEVNESVFHPRLLRNVPFVYKMHGTNWLFSRYCEDRNYFTAHRRLQTNMMWAAQQVHLVSWSQADFVCGACLIPPDRLRVTPNPLDLNLFRPGTSNITAEPPYRIMSVGRMESRKGHDTLARAMRLVWESEPDVTLYLHKGSGDTGMDAINKILPDILHQGRLKFIGHISDAELVQSYQQSHLYVTAARYETFGYTILEAMATARPVIATDIGPIPELVRDGETGWLFERDNERDLADKIVFALRNPRERLAFGQAGRVLAEKFSVDNLMEKQLALYNAVRS